MTVIAVLELTIKPDLVDGAPAVIGPVIEQTRAFPGNLGVDVVVDSADPTHWAAVERWESIEADDAYRAFRQTPEGQSDLGSLLAAAPVLTRYTLVDA